jgi:hypothetical protein
VKVEHVQYAWEADEGLETPESVKYDAENQVLYVANINGKPLQQDGNGYISKLGLDGKIIEKKWATGMDAPKGMGILSGSLFVSDINKVREIDLETGQVLNTFEATGAEFLNDVDVHEKKQMIFVSDMKTGWVHVLENQALKKWLLVSQASNPNGLYVKGDHLLIGGDGLVVKVFIPDREARVYIEDTGGIDGLEWVTGEKFIISDWRGSVHFIEAGKPKELLIEYPGMGLNAADIDYVPENNMLYIPTFNDHRVVAYKINK